MYLCIYVSAYLFIYVSMCLCFYISMYLCINVSICIYGSPAHKYIIVFFHFLPAPLNFLQSYQQFHSFPAHIALLPANISTLSFVSRKNGSIPPEYINVSIPILPIWIHFLQMHQELNSPIRFPQMLSERSGGKGCWEWSREWFRAMYQKVIQGNAVGNCSGKCSGNRLLEMKLAKLHCGV